VSRGSSVSIVSDYEMDDRGSIPSRDNRAFLLPLRPVRLWGLSDLLSSGYRGVRSPGVKSGRGVTLTTHRHLVQRSRTRRRYTSSPSKRLPRRVSGTALPYFTASQEYFQRNRNIYSFILVLGVCIFTRPPYYSNLPLYLPLSLLFLFIHFL
jgi:hypothetical protein